MNRESKNFIDRYKVDVPQTGKKIENANRSEKRRSMPQTRYTAPKGTAKSAKKRRKNKKINLRVASLLLAVGIGLGGAILIRGDKEPIPTITDIQEIGVSDAALGLEADTLQAMEKYDEFFENFDSKNCNLSEQEVENIANEIEDINFNVIKDKMGAICGANREDIKLSYRFERGDGGYNSSVIVHEGEYDKEQRYNDPASIIKNSSNSIPHEVGNLISQIGNYESIINDVRADKISKVNAIKELKKLYDKISEIATKDFIMDDKGNVSLIEYPEVEKAKQDKTEVKEVEEETR